MERHMGNRVLHEIPVATGVPIPAPMRHRRHQTQNAIDGLRRGLREIEITLLVANVNFRARVYRKGILRKKRQREKSDLLAPVINALLTRAIPRHFTSKGLRLRVPRFRAKFHGGLYRVRLLGPSFTLQVCQELPDNSFSH